jgi:hypothetical protein
MNKTSIKMVRQEKRNYLEKPCFVIKKENFPHFSQGKKKRKGNEFILWLRTKQSIFFLLF